MTEQIRPEPTGNQSSEPWPYESSYSAARPKVPEGLAIASAVIAIVLVAVQVSLFLTSIPAEQDFVDAVQQGGTPDDVLTLYDALALPLLAAMVAAYVVSCLWLQLSRRNALAISPHYPHARSAVWVWLGWWVPIVALWFPYQVVRDIRDGSQQDRKAIGLGIWWTSWLVFISGSRITARLASSTDPDTIEQLSVFEGVTTVAVVVACVQWCRILHRVTTDQQAGLAPR